MEIEIGKCYQVVLASDQEPLRLQVLNMNSWGKIHAKICGTDTVIDIHTHEFSKSGSLIRIYCDFLGYQELS